MLANKKGLSVVMRCFMGLLIGVPIGMIGGYGIPRLMVKLMRSFRPEETVFAVSSCALVVLAIVLTVVLRLTRRGRNEIVLLFILVSMAAAALMEFVKAIGQ